MTTRDDRPVPDGVPLLEVLRELLAETPALRAEVASLRRRNRIFGVSLVVSVLIGGGVMLDSRHQIAVNNARWCPVASAFLAVPQEVQQDPARRAASLEVRRFFTDLHRDAC